MTESTDELRREQLEDVEGELLPDREAMSVITPGMEDPMPFPIVPDKIDDPLRGGEAG